MTAIIEKPHKRDILGFEFLRGVCAVFVCLAHVLHWGGIVLAFGAFLLLRISGLQATQGDPMCWDQKII